MIKRLRTAVAHRLYRLANTLNPDWRDRPEELDPIRFIGWPHTKQQEFPNSVPPWMESDQRARRAGKSSAMMGLLADEIRRREGKPFSVQIFDPKDTPETALTFGPETKEDSPSQALLPEGVAELRLNRIKNDLAAMAKQYQEWADANSKRADQLNGNREAKRYRDLAIEFRNVAYWAQQIAKGRQ